MRHLLALLACCFCFSDTFAQSGSVDLTFNPGSGRNAGFDSDVFSIAVQPDGKLVVGGFFTAFDRTSRGGVARLNSDGTLDAGFAQGTGANNTVEVVTLQPDGKVLICGRFSTFDSQPQRYVARLNANGSLDTSFNPVVSAITLALVLQADGKVLIGGVFTTVNGSPRNYLARLNADGSLDTGFDPGFGPDLPVHTLARQPDGKVVIGGQFTTVAGANRTRLARLNADGTLDTTFDPGAGANLTVLTTAIQPDGKVLVGGDFTNILSTTRYYVARLNANGSLDATFDANIALAFGGVLALQPQVDGKIIAAGEFETVGGAPRKNIARLNPDGPVDSSFDPGAGATAPSEQLDRVRGVAVQADGRVVIGGGFTAFDGIDLDYIARLLGDQGGTIEFAAANFSVDEAAGNAVGELVRTGSAAGSVVVNVATLDGSAVAGEDYVLTNVVVSFAAGEIRKSFVIGTLWDSRVEGNETVKLVLGNPIGGVILGNQRTATLTILDNTNSAPIRFTSIVPESSSQFRLGVSGQSGRAHVLQASTNLFSWISLQTNVPASDSFDFVDGQAAGIDRRFYRVLAP